MLLYVSLRDSFVCSRRGSADGTKPHRCRVAFVPSSLFQDCENCRITLAPKSLIPNLHCPRKPIIQINKMVKYETPPFRPNYSISTVQVIIRSAARAVPYMPWGSVVHPMLYRASTVNLHLTVFPSRPTARCSSIFTPRNTLQYMSQRDLRQPDSGTKKVDGKDRFGASTVYSNRVNHCGRIAVTTACSITATEVTFELADDSIRRDSKYARGNTSLPREHCSGAPS